MTPHAAATDSVSAIRESRIATGGVQIESGILDTQGKVLILHAGETTDRIEAAARAAGVSAADCLVLTREEFFDHLSVPRSRL